jgi:hypothetical protein
MEVLCILIQQIPSRIVLIALLPLCSQCEKRRYLTCESSVGIILCWYDFSGGNDIFLETGSFYDSDLLEGTCSSSGGITLLVGTSDFSSLFPPCYTPSCAYSRKV